MNKRIQVGTIVKFLDKDGRMNGGTIVTFRDGKALINTLEGERIIKEASDLEPLKRKVTVGRVSNKEKEEFINQINEYNKEKGYKVVVEKPKDKQLPNDEEKEKLKRECDERYKNIVALKEVINGLYKKMEEKDELIEQLKRQQQSSPSTDIKRIQIAYEGLKEVLINDNESESTVSKLIKTIDKLVSLDNN